MNDTIDISSRFIEALNELINRGILKDKKSFAASIGCSAAMITEVSKGRSNVGVSQLQNTVRNYGVSATWLLTGTGEMFVSDEPSQYNNGSQETNKEQINSRVLTAVGVVLDTHKELKKSDFAKMLDIKPSTFSEILKGRMNASSELMALLVSNYGISPTWLLTGTGEMFVSDEQSQYNNGRQETNKEKINCRVLTAVGIVLETHKELKKSDFAKMLNIKPSTFSEILKGRMNASSELMALLVSNYGISSTWLLTGTGEMFVSDEPAQYNTKTSIKCMILERIKQYIDFKGISIAAFERSIGMANASFGKSLKNQGAIGTDKLEKILMVYPDISPMWLLKGKGEMLLKNGDIPTTHETAPIYLLDMLSQKDNTIREQAEEIGILKQRIQELTQRLGKSAGAASTETTTNER